MPIKILNKQNIKLKYNLHTFHDAATKKAHIRMTIRCVM